MVTIDFFSKDVVCDRYNLLKFNANVDRNDIIYTESGNAFNGFDRPFIVNVNYDVIRDSRLCSVLIPNFNGNNLFYCLINDIRPLRDNKCLVYIEIDAWMYYKDKFDVGNDNTLFQTTAITDYAYHDLMADYKVIDKVKSLTTVQYHNVIIVYHDSTSNQDKVYLLQTLKNAYFPFYSTQVMDLLVTLGIDSNNIIGVYLSPFDVIGTQTWVLLSDTPLAKVYYMLLDVFISSQFLIDYENKFTVLFDVVSNYKTKTVITDMNGAIVWQSERKDNGTRYINAILDINYDKCQWICSITDDSSIRKQTSPNLRFVINCVNLAYYLDYYQQYVNTQKSYDIELRKLQLDKQLVDGIGNTISSAVNMGGMSGSLGGAGAYGAIGAGIGGAISTGINYVATAEYNKRLGNIEDRRAKVQYDTISASNDSFLAYLTGEIEPSIYTLSIDNESLKSQTNADDEPFLTYNCRIQPDDVKTLLRTTRPSYISGDFQFIKMNEKDAVQLNTRFKHGVNFVSWKGD